MSNFIEINSSDRSHPIYINLDSIASFNKASHEAYEDGGIIATYDIEIQGGDSFNIMLEYNAEKARDKEFDRLVKAAMEDKE